MLCCIIYVRVCIAEGTPYNLYLVTNTIYFIHVVFLHRCVYYLHYYLLAIYIIVNTIYVTVLTVYIVSRRIYHGTIFSRNK